MNAALGQAAVTLGFVASALGAAVLACGELVRSVPLRVHACLGADGSRLLAKSIELTGPAQSGTVLGVLAEGRFGYLFPTEGGATFEPVAAVQVAGLVRRDRFLYRDFAGEERILLQPAPVALQGSLGIAVHFR